MPKRCLFTTAVLLAGLFAGPPALAEEAVDAKKPTARTGRAYRKPEPMSFVRIRDDATGTPAALQVANVRYEPLDDSRLKVTLYGAVHVGDAVYYDRLNRHFREHEVVLYELANDPKVLEERRDEQQPSILSMFQMDMGRSLGLENQLEKIDYDRPNFVHADIPLPELLDHAYDQGDDMLTATAQTLLDFQRMMNRGDDPFSALLEESDPGDPFGGLLGMSGDPRKMKVQMARQLVLQSDEGILEGITVLNRYLIHARNKRCLEVLERQIAAGRTDIAIFYGAGHNADFHRRLMADYGLKPVEVTWHDAWDLKSAPAARPNPADELSDEELMMSLLRRMLQDR